MQKSYETNLFSAFRKPTGMIKDMYYALRRLNPLAKGFCLVIGDSGARKVPKYFHSSKLVFINVLHANKMLLTLEKQAAGKNISEIVKP